MVLRLVVVIPHKAFHEFVDKKKLESVDTLPNLHERARAAIKEFVQEHTGYSKEPIACLSKFRGAPGSLRSIGVDVREILTSSPGSTIWELKVQEDMVVSVDYETLMDISYKMHQQTDEEFLDFLAEELKQFLVQGKLDESDDVISFIPFLALSKCLSVSKIDDFWGMEELNVPGVETVKLLGINVFNRR
jgi:hypothetical protein